MRKNITIISLNLFSLLLLALPSLVRLVAVETDGGVITNPITDATLGSLLQTILGAVVEVGIVLVAGSIIFAGFKYVTARGNTSKIQEAHKAIFWTVVGSAIVLGAYAVRQIVADTVSGVFYGT